MHHRQTNTTHNLPLGYVKPRIKPHSSAFKAHGVEEEEETRRGEEVKEDAATQEKPAQRPAEARLWTKLSLPPLEPRTPSNASHPLPCQSGFRSDRCLLTSGPSVRFMRVHRLVFPPPTILYGALGDLQERSSSREMRKWGILCRARF